MRRAIIAIAVLISTLVIASFGAGEVLSAPARRTVGPPPAELVAETVTLNGSSNGVISGWFSRGQPGLGAVLLLHGVRSDRRQMIERSQFLHAAGYSVLLVDLPAHGESGGDRITFGYRETEGVRAALRFLNETLPNERTAVIGVSLGAASLVLAGVSPAPSAVVLESMYPTINDGCHRQAEVAPGAAWPHVRSNSALAIANSNRSFNRASSTDRSPRLASCSGTNCIRNRGSSHYSG